MKVLFVDDNTQFREILYKNFTKWKWESVGAGSVQEALQIIDETFDVILSDIRLPRLSGLDLLKNIKDLFLGLEVVLMTAYEDVDVTINAVNLGAFSFILKPLDFEQLKDILERAASIKLARKQVQEYQNKLQRDVIKKTGELNTQREFLSGIIKTIPSKLILIDKNRNVVFEFQKYDEKSQMQQTEDNDVINICEFLNCYYHSAENHQCDCFFKKGFKQYTDIDEVIRNKIVVIYLKDNKNVQEKYFKFDFIPFVVKGKKCYLVSYEDITREKEMEIKLRLAERLAALGEMASGVAHELNQPLNGIGAYIQLLDSRLVRENRLDAEKTRLIFKEILGEIRRMSDLIQEMRKFGKPSNSLYGEKSNEEQFIIPPSLNIKTSLNDVLKFHRTQLNSHNITCEILCEENIPNPIISEDKIKQIFLNLLTNARDALDEKEEILQKENESIENFTKKITFSIEQSEKGNEEGVLISVADNGIGIREEESKRLLDPFYSSKSPGKGTGLGLSICYRIIKNLEGDMMYESKFMEGSIFKVFLPLKKEK